MKSMHLIAAQTRQRSRGCLCRRQHVEWLHITAAPLADTGFVGELGVDAVEHRHQVAAAGTRGAGVEDDLAKAAELARAAVGHADVRSCHERVAAPR